MTERLPMTFTEQHPNWNAEIAALPGASILQTSQWADVKASGGWRPIFRQWKADDGTVEAAALILRKKLFLNLEFWYIPRGPLLDWNNASLRKKVLDDLTREARKSHAVFIKMDPDVPEEFGVPESETWRANPAGAALLAEYRERGWVFSPQQIQFANSVWIDLQPTEEELLAGMKQRTRYKVRLAEKKGVTVRHGNDADFPMLYALYNETAARDQFIIRDRAYYLNVWGRFFDAGMLVPLIAEVEGQPVAAIMLFTYAQRSWYIYGMSSGQHREKMPNYLLQWEAIRTAKSLGSSVYDLWGAPDRFDETDRMWGVYQFKQGLGGYEVITPGAWDKPLNAPAYHLFVKAVPAFLSFLKRKR